MANSTLIKTILHKSLAEGVYRDLVNRNSSYYYFLGKTLSWEDDQNPPYPIDSLAYERQVRNEIITLKEIKPSDVALVATRYNWVLGEVYDMFDDEYSDSLLGLDIQDGGDDYTSLPTITVSGGGGSGASYTAVVLEGRIIGVDIVSHGSGYTTEPTVTVTGGGGGGAVLRAVLNKAPSGSLRLEDCRFYAMTEDYNVYVCLDNNNDSPSTVKPIGTQVDPIQTADGYVWKYMFNVPINLRNKFMSDTHIPVVSALTNQFYSNGSLDNIAILSKGSGYTSATVAASGDGFLEADPIFLKQVQIVNGGTGFTSGNTEVTFTDPVSEAMYFIASASLYLGQKISTSLGDFYEVVRPGTLSTVEPTHRNGIVLNGTTALKYVGTRVTGTATVSDGEVTSITLNGAVRDVNIISGGSGYTEPPSVNFTHANGTGAVGVVKMNTESGSVLYVTVVDSGVDYDSEPTVTFGNIWESGLTVVYGDQYYYNANLYTVTQAGTFSSTAPTHASGEVSNGTAKLTYVGSPATGVATLRYGAGYSSPPSVTVTDSTRSESDVDCETNFLVEPSNAQLLPIIENGQISSIIVKNAGIGYSYVDINITGDGSGATATADLTVGNIKSQQANNEILSVDGTISAIKPISGGYGYGVANITIIGDGTGATAEAVLDSASGSIQKVNLTNIGTNYTWAEVLVEGNGKGATLRAIVSPYGGHGKNSPDQLYARTLMFYSNVSTDLNQGVPVNNDYRQIGIIKNPRVHDSIERFAGQIGSACYIIETKNLDTNEFTQDTDVVVKRIVDGIEYDRLYRVVSSGSSYVLLQNLQNDIPGISDTFVKVVENNPNPPSFSAVSVGEATVDKYSGQMMYIDNKAGFTPSADETVTLRTILKF